jgi:hypothetical protein
MERLARNESNTVQTGRGELTAVNDEAAQIDDIARGSVHDDRVGAWCQNAGLASAIVGDADRLRDGHRTVSARIENADFSACCGLRNRPCEGLARRDARARIGIVARPRDPCPRRLRMRKRRQHRRTEQHSYECDDLGDSKHYGDPIARSDTACTKIQFRSAGRQHSLLIRNNVGLRVGRPSVPKQLSTASKTNKLASGALDRGKRRALETLIA